MATAQPIIIPIREAERLRAKVARKWLALRQRWHQAGLAVQWWLGRHTSYQPVFVLSTHRTGSNLLMDYLRHLPGVQCRSEVICTTLPFGLAPRQCSPTTAITHIRRSLHTLRSPVRACKLMLDQLGRTSLSLDALAEAFPAARFVILYRESLAEQYLSHEAAKRTQQWYMLDGQEPRQAKVYVSPHRLRAYCEEIRRAYRSILNHSWLPERSVLLSYEELTADPGWWLGQRICPLLDVAFDAPQTVLRKQNALPISERVENHREVAALLASPVCHHQYSWQRQITRRRAA